MSVVSTPNKTLRHHPKYYFEDGNNIFLVENDLFRLHRHFFVRESPVFRDMLSIPSGAKTTAEGRSDGSPIRLQDVKSMDFECMVWMFYNESYTDHSASAEKWSSILQLAHMWQFETMARAAFKAYVTLEDVEPIDKIVMGDKYDLPRKDLVGVYSVISTRYKPLSLEEAEKVGLATATLIAQTREETKHRGSSAAYKIVLNNLVDLKPGLYYP